MRELVSELLISLDGFAQGKHSPGYFGYFGPEVADWIKVNSAVPHRTILGRRTYQLLAALPAEARDENWTLMTTNPAWLFSRTLHAADWPGLEVVSEDLLSFVRSAKRADGPEMRTLGSLSLVKQLLAAGLVDRLKLIVCPLVLPQSGREPIFAGLPDLGFDLLSTVILDERVLLLEYRPSGAPRALTVQPAGQ